MSFQVNTGTGPVVAADVIGTPTAPSSGNQVGWFKLDVGAAGSSAPLSSSNPMPVGIQAGTNLIGTVQVVPGTSNGLSTYRALWPNNTTGINVKNSAGQLKFYFLSNSATSTRFVKLYDKATSPTVGTDTPSHTFAIPAGASANVSVPDGIQFSLGIGIGVTVNAADNDTTAPAANDVLVNLGYK